MTNPNSESSSLKCSSVASNQDKIGQKNNPTLCDMDNNTYNPSEWIQPTSKKSRGNKNKKNSKTQKCNNKKNKPNKAKGKNSKKQQQKESARELETDTIWNKFITENEDMVESMLSTNTPELQK